MSGFILIFFDDQVSLEGMVANSSARIPDGPVATANAGECHVDRSAVRATNTTRENTTIAKTSNAGRSGVTAGETAPHSRLLKTAADYRPHCQNKDTCAASGLQHCYACQKLIAAAEVSA